MKIPQLVLVTLLTLLTHTHAQDAATRTCRILFLERPANAPKSLHLFDGSTSQEVELPSMNLSPSYKLAPGAIQLKLLPTKVEDPKVVSPDAPSVDIPADHTNFFLLVSTDPENKVAPVKLKAINIESENFKLGQTLWINYTDKTIEAKLGAQTLSLEPDNSKVVDTPFSDKSEPTSGYYSASFTYQVKGEEGFSPITEQQWWHDATSRHIGFIVNSGGKLPKIFFFRDFHSPP